MITINVNNKEEKDVILHYVDDYARQKKIKVFSVEENIEKYFYNIIQIKYFKDNQYDFGFDEAVKQAKRHAPCVLIMEGK